MIETLTIYFRIPLKDTPKRKKWNNFVQENGVLFDKISKLSLICSLHFDDSCFVMRNSRKHLLEHAVPSKIINRIRCVSVHLNRSKQNKITL